MTLALVAGRWADALVVVDLARMAVARRIRTVPEGRIGLPSNVVLAADGRRAWVVNHAGAATPAAMARTAHGHAGTLVPVDLATWQAGRPIPTGTFGPVGLAEDTDGTLLVTGAEGDGTEDGGDLLARIDPATGAATRIALRSDGAPCPAPSPDPGFGRFPNPNGLLLAPAGEVWTANGGSDDVSVLAGGAEARIAMPSGPFALALSPDARLVAVACRESARTGEPGDVVVLVDRARRAVAATIEVGARPFGLAFTPDGARLAVACNRAGTLALVDVATRRCVAEVPLPGGAPRGVSIAPGGRHAAVSGGARGGGLLWWVDLAARRVLDRVKGVGDEPYLLALREAPGG